MTILCFILPKITNFGYMVDSVCLFQGYRFKLTPDFISKVSFTCLIIPNVTRTNVDTLTVLSQIFFSFILTLFFDTLTMNPVQIMTRFKFQNNE